MTGESKTQLICACCMAALGAGLFVGALFGIDYRARNKNRNKNS